MRVTINSKLTVILSDAEIEQITAGDGGTDKTALANILADREEGIMIETIDTVDYDN